MRISPHGRRHRACTWLSKGMAAVAVMALGGPAPAGAASAGASLLSAPLPAAMTTGTGTWAVVPMGHLGDLLNTFWQVFYRPNGGSRWALVTPPGVADNGGLVAHDEGAGSLTIGFQPSQNLLISPLAYTSDLGRTWSPGLVPQPLARHPDALAWPADRRRVRARAPSRWDHSRGFRPFDIMAGRRDQQSRSHGLPRSDVRRRHIDGGGCHRSGPAAGGLDVHRWHRRRVRPRPQVAPRRPEAVEHRGWDQNERAATGHVGHHVVGTGCHTRDPAAHGSWRPGVPTEVPIGACQHRWTRARPLVSNRPRTAERRSSFRSDTRGGRLRGRSLGRARCGTACPTCPPGPRW